MRVNRIHVDEALTIGARIALPENAIAHLVRVLRMQAGDRCTLFNGDGHDYAATIVSTGKRGTEVDIDARERLDNESPVRIVLMQAIARGEKMDWILQKATELGVHAFMPVTSERSEVRLDADRAGKRHMHWRSVVIAACEQSGRAFVPDVATPMPLASAMPVLPADGARLFLEPAAAGTLASMPANSGLDGEGDRHVIIAIGPEGGWSERDILLMSQHAFAGIRLGPRILRTETAGLAAIAALQSRFGDW